MQINWMMWRKKWFKRFIKLKLYSVSIILLCLIICNIWVILKTNKYIHQSELEIAPYRVALVLGTSKGLVGGGRNPFFTERINAAARLYNAGKVKHFILSGDNQTPYYNEPMDMLDAMRAKGIPNHAITLDYAGLRTLDSVIRSKKIFGQNKILVITQQFHAYRAVFIGQYYKMEMHAFAANDISIYSSIKTKLREFLARPLAVFDLYVLNREPKHLGDRIQVHIED